MKNIIATLLLCLGVIVAPLQALAEEVRIGLLCPLTGKWASEGQDMKNIVSLMLENYNAEAQKNGKNTIKLIIEDDAGDPRSAALAAQKLAASEVVAVIGTYGSAVTEASQNILAESGIVQIGTGSTSVRLTEKGIETFFRTSPRDDSQGKTAAEVIKQKGFKRIALLHDNSSYAKGLAQETEGFLKELDVEVIAFDALTPNEKDYSSVLTSLKQKNPDVIFFTGYYPETGLLLRQKFDMNYKVPMMGGDAANHRDLVLIAGNKAAEGYFFISPPLPQDLSSDYALEFLKTFKAKYNTMPVSVWAMLAGDAFSVLANAIDNGNTDPEKIANYIHNDMKPLEALLGYVSFDKKGDRIGNFYNIYVVNDKGEFVVESSK